MPGTWSSLILFFTENWNPRFSDPEIVKTENLAVLNKFK
jgi:hypothetical protein